MRNPSRYIAYSLLLSFLYSQTGAKFLEQGKSLTREQEDFLRQLAEYDDALWEQETKSLFKKYSQLLNGTTKELPKSTKSQQQSANVIVFKLSESELFTPEGINLTAVLAALNRNNVENSPVRTKAEEDSTERVKEVQTTTEEILTTRRPRRTTTTTEEPRSTWRNDLSNSTEIPTMNLNNGNGTSGIRNQTSAENHIFNQVQKIITASGQGNISGILDASLSITGNSELTNFVNGIFGVVYCNAIRRLLGRC